VAELEIHRQLPTPCLRNPSSLKEGISEAQWASLDEKRHSKKNKGSPSERPKTNVEKWNDIWVILFPDIPVPNSPCKHGRLTFWYAYLPKIVRVRSASDTAVNTAVFGREQRVHSAV
jgi:hypothetical protein